MKKTSSLLRTLSFVLAFIGLAMVVRRILALQGLIPSFAPPGSTGGSIPGSAGGGIPASSVSAAGGEAFDAGFGRHPVLTLIHIVPGAVPAVPPAQREWMIRAFAVGLAVATIRPIIALFFIFSRLSPHVFFGTAFWIGFVLHAMAAEVWINSTRKSLALV